jgi:hypothetical protein
MHNLLREFMIQEACVGERTAKPCMDTEKTWRLEEKDARHLSWVD